MASIIIIPILIVVIVGLSSYLVHKFVLRDILAKRSINQTLQKYNIKKTPSEIIKEYYENRGERLSHQEIQNIEKHPSRKSVCIAILVYTTDAEVIDEARDRVQIIKKRLWEEHSISCYRINIL